jgi:hypothetical protein
MKLLDEEDRKLLQEIYSSNFLHGGCGSFAIALSDRTGWKEFVLGYEGYGEKARLIHVGLKDDKGLIWDINGAQTIEEFGAPMWCGMSLQYVDKETLIKLYPGANTGIDRARGVIDLIFPDLPGEAYNKTKFENFVKDLIDVCVKHGLWLRDPHGTSAFGDALIYTSFGDEEGYELEQALNPNELRIKRVFKP